MNKYFALAGILFTMFFALSGCVHTMTIESPTIEEPAIPWLTEAQSVTLLNGSKNKDKEACSNMVHKWTINEYDLTESLITTLTQVLSKSNIHVKDKAAKRLLLVTSVGCNSSSGDMFVQIMARTGDGKKKNFGDSSWAPFQWQTQGAFEESYAISTNALLADKDIMDYLSKQ